MSVRRISAVAGFVALPLVLATICAGVGKYHIAPGTIWRSIIDLVFAQDAADPQAYTLLTQVRLPRVFGAVVVGAGLAVSGAIYQAVFRNPLCSPYTLGVSNGAGFGAALAILTLGSGLAVQASAVVMALIAVGLTFLFASTSRGNASALILSGILVGALFASLTALIKFVADPYEKLPQIIFWLMGSIASIGPDSLKTTLPAYILILVLIAGLLWRLTVISVDETFAQSVGVQVRRDRTIALIMASALASLCISIAGVIGWVGIVVPHYARMIVGPQMRAVFGASISLGASFMLLIDLFARTLIAGELPVGVLTGVVGLPLFLLLVFRRKIRFV